MRPYSAQPNIVQRKPFAGEAERSGKRGYCAERSVQRSTASAATTRNASEGVRDSASLRPALHCSYSLYCAQHARDRCDRVNVARAQMCVFF